ncbi:MAG: hypothetical protein Q4B70_15010 [Lachnospiraceae bacterium]|nr:hypothetical protein [Lachnospiraceae bacterium]
MGTINDKEIIEKVQSSMHQQWQQRGYATPVDTLIGCGVLTKKAYEEWRFGKVPYLEKCCTVNLRKLSFILRKMREYADKNGWKASFCYYKQWGVKKKQGHKKTVELQFSKSGATGIERQYATHFVDGDRIKMLKE